MIPIRAFLAKCRRRVRGSRRLPSSSSRPRVTRPERSGSKTSGKARESRLGVPGELIAYYTRAATVFERVLPEHQLRFSSFDQMRDPRENKDWVSYVTGGESAKTASSLEEIAQQMNAPRPFDMHEALVNATALDSAERKFFA